MGSGIFFPLCALPFSMLMIILFNSKKHINNKETKIFNFLVISNFIGLILEIFCTNASMIYLTYPMISNCIYKAYLFYIILWISTFAYYVFVITKNEKENSKRYILFILYYVIIILLLIILPINVVIEDDFKTRYTSGLSVMLSYILSGIAIISVIYMLLKNIKKIWTKKYYPIFAFLLIGGLAVSIQSIYPQILMMTYVETFICVMMYNTIENPDLQMLKEFHKAKEQAEESNREKTNFLFNISNEIKKPINNIIYTSENAINKQEISDIKNDLRTIKGDSNNLLSYVNNVLDISDEEIRQIEIKGSKYNSKRLFEIISKKYEPTLNKIEYRFKYDNSTPEYLYGDSMRIKQIVNILLENAREYTKQGYIELSVNSIVKNEICRLVITVEDSGTGMDTETIKHLFDKDKIYDDKLLKEIDDTKNNLSILKSIVNLMNGSVLVESTIGSGSKFTVILDQKISTEKTKIEEQVEEYEKMYEKDKKIILVTDNKEISTKIQKILKKQPYKLEIVTLGQTCLEQIRSGTEYDLIIIDEEIPKLNYEDTLNKIKETKCYKKPVLLITSNQIFGSKEMYQEKGFKDTIYKPIKKEELIHEIEEYINE